MLSKPKSSMHVIMFVSLLVSVASVVPCFRVTEEQPS